VLEVSRFGPGLDVWVDAGTLLGLYRQGDFIPHDTDVDFGVALSSGQAERAPIITEPDYQPLRALYWRGLPMQQAYLFKNEVLDFYFFYDDIKPGFLTNVSDGGVMEIPEELIRPIARNFNWENANLPTPNQLETYLSWRYGEDWKTPKTDKQPWFSDHPNIEPRDYAMLLEPREKRTNPSNWTVGSITLSKSASSTLELDNLDIAVFENQSLISLWSSRNGANQQRDSLLTERDSLLTERDSLLTERDSLLTERDSLLTERDSLLIERDSLLIERDSLLIERDSLRNSRSWKYTRALRAVWGFFAR
jgi:hypothetical protein